MKNQKLLEEMSWQIFKGDGSYNSLCFNLGRRNEVKDIYLPCHLRDNEWLIKLFQTNKKLKNISYIEIKEFIASSFFQNLRHAYELKIVSWLINCRYNDFFLEKDINCDLRFREVITYTLKDLGLDQEVIEEGLEKTRSYWLKPLMRRAFYNQNNLRDCLVENIEDCNDSYEEAWLQLREYEYYQEHKAMVDKYGIIFPSMQLPSKRVKEIKEYIKTEATKRKEYLEKVKEGLQKGLKQIFILQQIDDNEMNANDYFQENLSKLNRHQKKFSKKW